MYSEIQVQNFHFGNQSIELLVPNQEEVKNLYKQLSLENPNITFPFWTQVWPSAIAMAQFIVHNPMYFIGKRVTELAAGLGLPSFIAANLAAHVYCTDYLPEAVELMQMSVNIGGINNISCGIIDWNEIPTDFPKMDVLLLSDINYNPADFETLYQVLTRFLALNCTLILTTPQRLLAKPFIEKLMHFCSFSQEIVVSHLGKDIQITVLVLS